MEDPKYYVDLNTTLAVMNLIVYTLKLKMQDKCQTTTQDINAKPEDITKAKTDAENATKDLVSAAREAGNAAKQIQLQTSASQQQKQSAAMANTKVNLVAKVT